MCVKVISSTDVQPKESARPRETHGYERRGRIASTKSTLWPVLRGLGIQGRDQLLGCRGHGHRSGKNNVPRRNFPAVHMAVVTIVRTDGGAFERDAGK